MIITCEQCHARYLLASLLLGSRGRTVRCGVCGHTWYQEAMDEEEGEGAAQPAVEILDQAPPQSFADHLDHEILDPIPQGVRPLPDIAGLPSTRRKFALALPAEKLVSYGAAAAVFLVVFAALVGFRGAVVHAWPPSILLYDQLHLAVAMPGDGLVFDQVTAKSAPDDAGKVTVTVEGNIINLKPTATELPLIEATLRKSETDSATGPHWRVAVREKKIGPEKTIPFKTSYSGAPADMQTVTIRFTVH